MAELAPPPSTFSEFCERLPELAKSWQAAQEAGQSGPMDHKTQRLIKLGIAFGAMGEGAVHSAVRKARAAGVTDAELDQALALAAPTLGFPSTVALYSWVRDEGDK
jgi:4-carboxymuconolactone decarboxylase